MLKATQAHAKLVQVYGEGITRTRVRRRSPYSIPVAKPNLHPKKAHINHTSAARRDRLPSQQCHTAHTEFDVVEAGKPWLAGSPPACL
ncbi:hypothetical protein OESDEN_03913 [Oesophagostomum dentatum]|uniref:Uncharacterized protein n=1 Tax=Oesophagostomum dentatum TaxID=61180 RepID=A0A0B1TF53_OESDE|nr:hypothetical protein OESDEN_03913 [Oesophagostomum dentatum]